MLRLIGIVAVVLSSGFLAQGAPIVSDYYGNLYDINLATGAVSNKRLADANFISYCAGITYRGNDLYMLTAFGGTYGNSLFKVNPATAAVISFIGSTGHMIIEGDVAADPTTGAMYALLKRDSNGIYPLRLDPNTAAATVLAPLPMFGGSWDYSAMMVTDAGDLYALDNRKSHLMRLDKTTGSVLSSIDVSLTYAQMGDLAGMAQDPETGTVYVVTGVTASLYTLNLSDGNMTLIGPTGMPFFNGLSGLAFQPVPEPAGLALLVLGGACLFRRRRPSG